MTEEKSTLPVQIEPILQLIQSFVPEADLKTGNAVKAMEAITVIETDEDEENAAQLLGKIKGSYDKFSALRKSITEPLDQLKSELMQYEKRVAYDGKTDNHYTRVRGLISSYKQKKLDEIARKEAEAAKKRELEDYKVDLASQMRQKLVNMVMERVVNTDEWAKVFFNDTPLEKWDERVKFFNSIKPGLQEKYYNDCLVVVKDNRKINDEQFNEFLEEFKKSEPFEKWKEMVMEGIVPVLNDWRAKIPMLKSEKIELANANENNRARLEQEQKERAEQEEIRKKEEFAKLQKETNKQIEQEAEMSKMSNAFVEQATVQQTGEKGPIKLVLKFTDPKLVPKALSHIILHCISHKDFPGIQKRDAKKNLVFDDKGRPEYVDTVQKWIDWFLAHCDAQIEGTVVTEDAKVIVRK